MLACDIIRDPQYHSNDATRGAINYSQVRMRITRLFDVEFAALLTCCVWIVREEYLLPEGFGLSVPRGDERFVAISAAAGTVKEFVFEILLRFFFKEKKTSPSEPFLLLGETFDEDGCIRSHVWCVWNIVSLFMIQVKPLNLFTWNLLFLLNILSII